MRLLSTALIVAGALLVAWTLVVWRFGDPVTGAWYRFEQRRLAAAYERREQRFAAVLLARAPRPRGVAAVERRDPPKLAWTALERRLAAAAARYARALEGGDPVGEIVVERLGLHTMMVDGTASSDLRRGPGLDERAALPGSGRLVYVAGHRTTFGAPFSAIETLRKGDTAELRLPYATFVYRVTGHRIVPADDTSVLRDTGREHLILQACHPRFFAHERYLVDARLVAVRLWEDGSTRTVRPVT